MASMRELMEMVGMVGQSSDGPMEMAGKVDQLPNNPGESRQFMLDQLDRLLGTQVLTKQERADILDEIASSATRMSRVLRDSLRGI